MAISAISRGAERVATHSRNGREQRSTIETHLPEGRAELRHRSQGYWEERADRTGSDVGIFVREVFGSDDVLLQLRAVQAIVTCLETGVGKSHIAQSLGRRACRLGKSVLYVAAQDLFKQLRAAKADGSHDKRILRFTTPDLLVVDDLGLRALRDEEPLDLYDIIRARYERHSPLITSNRAPSELGALFGDPLLASAAMDRLLHDAHVVILDGDSFRNPPAERRKPKKNSHQEKQVAWIASRSCRAAADRSYPRGRRDPRAVGPRPLSKRVREKRSWRRCHSRSAAACGWRRRKA